MNSLSKEGSFPYKSITIGYKYNFDCYNILSLFFRSLPHEGSLTLYSSLQTISTLVDHLSPYLSTCPIRHLLWFSVSCDSQDSTVQESSPHKCGQKSSYSAFNAVVATFPQIFFGFLLFCMFIRHVPIIETSWRITLIVRVHILNYIHHFREGVPPQTTFRSFPTYETLTGNM